MKKNSKSKLYKAMISNSFIFRKDKNIALSSKTPTPAPKSKYPVKKIAAICMMRIHVPMDEMFANRWIAYYGKQLGEENLYIIMDGLDQKAPGKAGKANIIIREKNTLNVYDLEQDRRDVQTQLAWALFKKGYQLVIGCDSDEFLVADPNTGMSMAEYISSLKIKGSSISGLGLDFGQHLKLDKPFDLNKNLLEQREYALLSTRFTKAVVMARPVRWGWGWHRIMGRNFHIEPNLYLMHFGNTDFDQLYKKSQNMEIIASGRAGHFKRRRLSASYIVSEKTPKDFDKAVRAARIMQTLMRPPYA